MDSFFDSFNRGFSFDDIEEELAEIVLKSTVLEQDINVLKSIFSCIDLTTLSTNDSATSVQEFVEKVNGFPSQFPEVPNVAAVCVYPVFSPIIKNYLKIDDVKRACVAGGFPASQTFLDVKVAEARKAVDFGANEIDVVISVGEFLDGNYEFVFEEVRKIKEVIGEAHLKVILETGAMESPQDIWEASLIVMEAGADFIKTSTGKLQPAATLEAAYVMVQAIKAFFDARGRKVGFKPAGGISETDQAIAYYLIIKEVLGNDWLSSEWFRIGASRLANCLLTDIQRLSGKGDEVVAYF